MNNVFRLTWYLLAWQRTGKWLFISGAAVAALTPLLAWLLDARFAYGVWIYAYISALVLPFLAAPLAFRQLLALRRMGLAPAGHFTTGLSLLLFASLLALLMPLGAALYWPGILPDYFGLQVFVIASLYAGLLQWAVTSARAVLGLSFVFPGLFIIILNLFHSTLLPWFQAPVLNLLLFALCVAAWCLGLKILSSRRNFRAICTTPMDSSEHTGWLGKLLSARSPATIRTAAGSLLQGFPDNWCRRALATLSLTAVSPLLCTIVLVLIGRASNNPGRLDGVALFMLISMITANFMALFSGELAARARLLWLKVGGNRSSVWAELEKLLTSNLILLNLLAAIIALLCMLLSEQKLIRPLDYYLVIASFSLLASYFSLTARICQWSRIGQMVLINLAVPVVALGFLPGSAQSQVFLLAGLIVLIGLGMRWYAKRAFVSIDWTQVKPRQLPQMKR